MWELLSSRTSQALIGEALKKMRCSLGFTGLHLQIKTISKNIYSRSKKPKNEIIEDSAPIFSFFLSMPKLRQRRFFIPTAQDFLLNCRIFYENSIKPTALKTSSRH